MDPRNRYQRLWSKLTRVRWIYAGLESEEEDVILDQMDHVWSLLTPEEQSSFSAQPARSLLRTEARELARALVDVSEDEVSGTPNSPLRILLELEEAA